MVKRTTTGIFITVGVYVVLWYSHIPAVLTAAVSVLSIIAAFELFRSANIEHNTTMLCITVITAVSLAILPIPNYNNILPYIFTAALLLFFLIMRNIGRCQIDSPIWMMGISILIVFLFRSITELRNIEHGFYYLLFSVTLCFATDVMAYLTGKLLGKRKLCPQVSPNKTVAGSIGGIVGAVLTMLVLTELAQMVSSVTVNRAMLIIYAILGSAVAQYGDLAMSAVKRCLGVKDFGYIFPGHGGILDRFDSHLFCVAYTLLYCSLTGGFIR